MTLEETAIRDAFLAKYTSVGGALIRDGALYATIVPGTQLRHLPDEYEDLSVFYTHDDSLTGWS